MSRSYNDNPPGSMQCRGCEAVVVCAPGCPVQRYPRAGFGGPLSPGVKPGEPRHGQGPTRFRCVVCSKVFASRTARKTCSRLCRNDAYTAGARGKSYPRGPIEVLEAA